MMCNSHHPLACFKSNSSIIAPFPLLQLRKCLSLMRQKSFPCTSFDWKESRRDLRKFVSIEMIMPDFLMSLRTTWWGHLDEVREKLRTRLLSETSKPLLEVLLLNFRQILMEKRSQNESGSNTFAFETILKSAFSKNSENRMSLFL